MLRVPVDLKSSEGSFLPLKLLIACRYLQQHSTASSGTTQLVFSLIASPELFSGLLRQPWVIYVFMAITDVE